MRILSGLVAIFGLALASSACGAAIIAVDLGTGAPPATLGGYTIVPFGPDSTPVPNNVNSVPSPISGSLGFGTPVSAREIGNGWLTWSHGYTGDIYYNNGVNSLLLTLPANTGAFYFYAEPNLFSAFTITATANDGTTLALIANGDSGAAGFGFYATPGQSISSINVTSNTDFAVGEFGIAAATEVPEPASIAVFGVMMVASVGGAMLRKRRKTFNHSPSVAA